MIALATAALWQSLSPRALCRARDARQAMLKRAESVQRSQSLYYSLGAKRFADLSIVIHAVAEIILEYALRTRSGQFVFLFSSLNKAARELLFEALRNLPLPSMGDFEPWSGNDPAFSTLRDRVSWQFVRCQMCGDDATERSLVVVVDEARTATILTCQKCDQNMHAERIAKRGCFLTGKSFVLLGCDISTGTEFDASRAETLRRNIESVRTKVVKVARQKWTTSPIGARAARRSIPFSDLGKKASAPLVVSGGRARVIKSVEIVIVVAIPGCSATQVYRLCLLEATAAKLIEAPSSTDRIKRMLSSTLNLRQHRTLLHFMSTATADLPVQTHPRKNDTPLKTPLICCTHGYGASRPHVHLLRCSACNGRDA